MYVFELKEKLQGVDDMKVVECELHTTVNSGVEAAAEFLKELKALDGDAVADMTLTGITEKFKGISREAGRIESLLPSEDETTNSALVGLENRNGTNNVILHI